MKIRTPSRFLTLSTAIPDKEERIENTLYQLNVTLQQYKTHEISCKLQLTFKLTKRLIRENHAVIIRNITKKQYVDATIVRYKSIPMRTINNILLY